MIKKSAKVFFAVALSLLIGLAAYGLLWSYGKPVIESAGRWAMESYIYERAGHSHSWEFYMDKLEQYLEGVGHIISPTYWLGKRVYAVLIFTAVFLAVFRKNRRKNMLHLGVGLLLLDLYVFSWGDIRTDFAEYSSLNQSSPVIDVLSAEKASGNLSLNPSTISPILSFTRLDMTSIFSRS